MQSNASLRRLPRLAAALLLAGSVGGCYHIDNHLYFDHRDSVSFSAGDAVAANKVAQMIDPWPAAAANRNIQHDGQRMARAAERYRTNRVTPLTTTSTSSTQYVPVMAPSGGGGTTP